MEQAGESLAGCIVYVELPLIDALETMHDLSATEQLWSRGGFPESLLAKDDDARIAWRWPSR